MRQEEPMDLWVYEREAFDAGIKLVCGVDEAGRGPLAGPVCAAAVMLPPGLEIPGLNDSKKLTDKKRRELCSVITAEDAAAITQRSAMRYDRGGDAMYDLASALMKSLRGSDPDAALHYLARFLEAGDLVTPCRRLLCSASEDVGMAYPQAISIVKACVDTAMQLGLPEAQLPLAQAAILLATAPKSTSVVEGIGRAWSDVKHGKTGDVPRELQNVHADSTGMEREQGYKYPHSYLGHWVRQQYLPDAIKDARYYEYGDNKTEQAARAYWEKIKNQ